MNRATLNVVTGALGYSGKSLTELLLARGEKVRTLTNSPNRPNPFGDRLEIRPLAFDDPGSLVRSLEGADTLYNTYWVRFNHRLFTFQQAVANTKILFEAAKSAGVRRVVHVSILHADEADDLGYFKGKHELESTLQATGLSHAILRPGVLFGRGDILVNNIAWVIRHLPIFGLYGDGAYKLRPIHVDDMAALMLDCAERTEDTIVDAVGPETFTYRELVETIIKIIGVRRTIVRMPSTIGYWLGRCLNPIVRDVVITREEIEGLLRGLLDSESPPTGATLLTAWMKSKRTTLGQHYASEIARRAKRESAYADL